jgi:hypothetical protein
MILYDEVSWLSTVNDLQSQLVLPTMQTVFSLWIHTPPLLRALTLNTFKYFHAEIFRGPQQSQYKLCRPQITCWYDKKQIKSNTRGKCAVICI